MKLIDADKAGAELACYYSPTGIVDETLYDFASNIINEAPTVDAIPIEWIIKFSKKQKHGNYKDFIDFMIRYWKSGHEL